LQVSTRLQGVIRQNTILFLATRHHENLRSFASRVHFFKTLILGEKCIFLFYKQQVVSLPNVAVLILHV